MSEVPVVAEIGINHNGDPEMARRLIDAAHYAGCAAVKFQKRTPHLCVPPHVHDQPKVAPWGEKMTYIEYRARMEFSDEQYVELQEYAMSLGLGAFYSVWDRPSLEFVIDTCPDEAAIKIPSAMCTNFSLVRAACQTGRPVWVSTGGTRWQDVRAMGGLLRDRCAAPLIFHCHASYPAPPHEANLSLIPRMAEQFGFPVGFSNHHVGTDKIIQAVTLGASVIEVHITLDRSLPGSDHQSSIEPLELAKLVARVQSAHTALGDGEKVVWESERPAMEKLRWIPQDDE